MECNQSGCTPFLFAVSDHVYIFEFKINGTAEEAMKQIHEKGYAVPFEADPRTVFLIGANFSTEARNLDGWIIEKLNCQS